MPSGIRRRRAAKSGQSATKRRRGKPKTHSARTVSTPGLVGEHWDSGATLLQNYSRLGLAARLQRPAGGVEKDQRAGARRIEQLRLPQTSLKTGRIVTVDGETRIVYDDDDKDTPATESKPPLTPLVAALEAQAAAAVPVGRNQSEGEQQWLTRLIEKHGDDYVAMQFDRKLNTFQHSAGELKKRIRKLRATKN